jgi:hypothetical protein
MILLAVEVLVIDIPAAIASSAVSLASGSRSRVLLLVWCPFLLILKPERRRACDPSPSADCVAEVRTTCTASPRTRLIKSATVRSTQLGWFQIAVII